MEKFAEIINAMRFCAGPDCNEKCPYFNRSANAKSCRSMLLEDATAALTSETMQGECYREKIKRLRDQAAERDAIATERDKLAADVDHLEAENNAYRTERDALREAYRELDAELHRTQQRETALLNGKKIYQHYICFYVFRNFGELIFIHGTHLLMHLFSFLKHRVSLSR